MGTQLPVNVCFASKMRAECCLRSFVYPVCARLSTQLYLSDLVKIQDLYQILARVVVIAHTGQISPRGNTRVKAFSFIRLLAYKNFP